MTPQEIAAAAIETRKAIDPFIRTTPLELLSEPDTERRAYAKCEHLQVTGSFKARGALSRLMSLDEDQRAEGVVTASTGNHGAAVAYGAHHLGIGATVFVPESVSDAKLANILRWGAAIERVPGDPIEGERRARAVSESTEKTYVSPYNDLAVITGQATIGVELVEQLDHVDTLIVSVGGGGLISGVGAVVRDRWPHVRIVGCAAANSKVMLESVAAGELLDLPSLPTLSDGTAGSVETGAVTFDLCRQLVNDWLAIDEESIKAALVGFVNSHHQIIEGSAAMALAAREVLIGQGQDLGTTVVISCGANIDTATLGVLLT